LLFSFQSLGVEGLGIFSKNILNLLVILYFFQGFGVMMAFLDHYQVSPLIRMFIFIYLILLAPLFIVILAFGVVDYWVDFRQKLANKKKEKKDINS